MPKMARYEHSNVAERRRFPPPWSIDELEACFVVRDHNGQQLASRGSPHFFSGCGLVALFSG
jgi:hypothetical protein